MSDVAWQTLDRSLHEAAERGRPIRFWWRDDDAQDASPELDRLSDLAQSCGGAILLACVPARATPALADHVLARPHLQPCQHGWSHHNHAAAGERACELGGQRGDVAVLGEVGSGQQLMRALFGTALVPALVPPWNRIRPSLLDALPDLGLTQLSTFSGASLPASPGLDRLDSDLDIIDWRGGRVGRSDADLCERLVHLMADRLDTDRPIGLLTHHLAHDAQAWGFLDRLTALLASHPGARFATFPAEIDRRPG